MGDERTPDTRYATALHGDVVGYSKLVADNEIETYNTLQVLRRVIDQEVESRGGTIASFVGDEFLAVLPSEDGAVSAAIIMFICCISVGVGWLAVRRQLPTAADYFTAGGVFGPVALAIGIFMSFVSFFGYFGLASLSYRTGLGSLAVVGMVSVFSGLLLYLVHRKTVLLARPLGWRSQGMVFGSRYGRTMQLLVPVVME